MTEVDQIIRSRYLHPEVRSQPNDTIVGQSVDLLLRVLKELNVHGDAGELDENLRAGDPAE
jgi:hypothetical protein